MLLYRSWYVLAVQAFILCSGILANSETAIEGNSAAGEWSQWTSWTPCSAKCRTGITARNRTCRGPEPESSRGDKKVSCPGKEKEIKLCNKQECADGKRGWRDEECTKYDTSIHSGRQYFWEPFTHPSDPCALTCRAKGHHFYTTLTDRVVDGTPCGGATTQPSAVCLKGVCQEVGCDDIVGSPWRRDACGVCKGDNTTCRTVSGIFSQEAPSAGMNEIISIPAGSTLINVTGLSYSINWLALQNEHGDYILNGGETKSPSGDYEAAGTIFSYKTSQRCSGQCITAQGPIDQTIKLMLKTRGNNRGVQYSFNVPLNVTDHYFRRIIDPIGISVNGRETSSQARNSDRDERDDDEDTTANMENDQLDSSRPDAGIESDGVDRYTVKEQRGGREGREEEEEEEEEGEEEEEEEGREQLQQQQQQQQPNQESNAETKDSLDLHSSDDDDVDPQVDESDDVFEGNAEEPNDDEFDDDLSLDSDLDGSNSVSVSSSSDEVSERDSTVETPDDERNADNAMYTSDDDDDDDDDDDGLEEKGLKDADDLSDDFEVGAPEPLHISEPPNGKIKIIKKTKPEFVDSQDTSLDAFTGGVGNSELKSDIQRESRDDASSTHISSTFRLHTTDPSDEGSTRTETTPSSTDPHTSTPPPTSTDLHTSAREHTSTQAAGREETSPDTSPTQASSKEALAQSSSPNQTLSVIGVTPKQTSLPQSDSPGRPTLSPRQRPRAGSRKGSSSRRFRRPNYSQSFTFRRGFRQRTRAKNKAASSRRGSAPASRHSLEQPRIMTARINSPASRDRQIRFRPTPRRQSSGRQRPGRVASSRQPTHDRNPHRRSRGHSGVYPTRRRTSQRQALTLGDTASRDEDGFLTLRADNKRSRNRPSPTTNSNVRQHSHRENSNRRREGESSRQQREYTRQQEYRREMRRRRQEMEKQRAAQEAEYQRRLDDYNRRVRQRQLEQQRRQQQQNSDHSRRHHSRRRHQQQQQHHLKSGRRGHQDRQQNLHLAVPTSAGARSRVDTPGNSASSQRGRGSDARQRTFSPRSPSSPFRTPPTVQPTARDMSRQRYPGIATTAGLRIAPTAAPRRVSASGQGTVPAGPSTRAPTRDFLTNPAEQTITPTRPALLPSAVVEGGAPVPPRFIPDDSRHDARSSLNAPSSNELPDEVITPLVIGPEGNVVPTVNERRLLIGGEGSLLPREGGRDKTSYEWRVSGLTECTLTCGRGLQQTAVVCLDIRTQAVVTNGNCAHLPKPEIKAVTCNTRPCPAEWQTSQWTACSVSCGPGQQTRLVTCTARVSPTLNLTRPEENCQGSTKPEARRSCQNVDCTAWKVGRWSKCSVQCGEGVRTRDVFCGDHTGFDVSDDLCPGSKPEAEEACEMGPCGRGWYYTQWPEQCPVRCGSGTKSRHVTCLGGVGEPLPEASCDSVTRPDLHQRCQAPSPCGGQWFSGEWTECNVTCGRGFENREALCMKFLPGGLLTEVDDENCNEATKPETAQPCQLDACVAEWYMTSWTQCSQSCGTGQRTREVKCLDPQQRPTSDCPLAEKPRTREACNTQKCVTRPSTPAGADCQDTFSRCEIVRHARMCRYPFYKKKCCATCSENT